MMMMMNQQQHHHHHHPNQEEGYVTDNMSQAQSTDGSPSMMMMMPANTNAPQQSKPTIPTTNIPQSSSAAFTVPPTNLQSIYGGMPPPMQQHIQTHPDHTHAQPPQYSSIPLQQTGHQLLAVNSFFFNI